MRIYLTLVLIALLSCNSGEKDGASAVKNKQVQVEKLKKKQQDISKQIADLEAEILKLDPSLAKEDKAKLVVITPVKPENFVHYIELQGKIDAENVAYVAPPNAQGGVVKALYVNQGQSVTKGQVLAQLDPMTLQQQIEPLRVQLETARDVYNRRQNLWKQGIGTEVELIASRTQVETLERQIAALQKQISLFTVRAPMSGIADVVNVRVGEMFMGQTAAGPQIRIVNNSELKAVAQVPENYLSQVKPGNPVVVYVPDVDKTINAKINVAGRQIDPLTRAFYTEANIPSSNFLRPNQVAVMKIQDYAKANAITIPINTLQNDEKGKYVMVAVKEEGKFMARKRPVIVGQLNNDRLEVISGLQEGDQLITEGFQNLYDGQLITTETK